MKRAVPVLALALGLTLSACSQGTTAPTGGRPELPTGAEVRHPATPAGAPVYLNLLSDAGESFYQTVSVPGSTATTVDPTAWRGKEAGKTTPATALVPAGATNVVLSDPAAQVLTLRWVMWQDANSSGAREESETLPLMSHDRAVYADKAVTASFRTATPDMEQRWTFAGGWSRAAHYVYLPLPTSNTTYRRSLSSDTLQRYELHVPTPVTSQ